MEFCNKGMVRADPPPQLWSKTINLHFFFLDPSLINYLLSSHHQKKDISTGVDTKGNQKLRTHWTSTVKYWEAPRDFHSHLWFKQLSISWDPHMSIHHWVTFHCSVFQIVKRSLFWLAGGGGGSSEAGLLGLVSRSGKPSSLGPGPVGVEGDHKSSTKALWWLSQQ